LSALAGRLDGNSGDAVTIKRKKGLAETLHGLAARLQ
jgi:hypothetical protein